MMLHCAASGTAGEANPCGGPMSPTSSVGGCPRSCIFCIRSSTTSNLFLLTSSGSDSCSGSSSAHTCSISFCCFSNLSYSLCSIFPLFSASQVGYLSTRSFREGYRTSLERRDCIIPCMNGTNMLPSCCPSPSVMLLNILARSWSEKGVFSVSEFVFKFFNVCDMAADTSSIFPWTSGSTAATAGTPASSGAPSGFSTWAAASAIFVNVCAICSCVIWSSGTPLKLLSIADMLLSNCAAASLMNSSLHMFDGTSLEPSATVPAGFFVMSWRALSSKSSNSGSTLDLSTSLLSDMFNLLIKRLFTIKISRSYYIFVTVLSNCHAF
nr:unnamed protein product [Spodoptera littoralis]